jgi:hypothetical protein
MSKLTKADKRVLSSEFNLPVKSIETIVAIESGGRGFDTDGKIIIQFEPSWFKRKWLQWTKSIGPWASNGVENQTREWLAFNDAFKRNPTAAMESTSIGLMQVMGFHYKLLGFATVGAMWDYAEQGEYQQLRLGLLFIKNNRKMYGAAKDFSKMSNCETFAYYYNGSAYKKYNYHNKLYNYNRSL